MPQAAASLAQGLLTTIELTLAAAALAVVAAIAAGLGRSARSAAIRTPVRIYVEVFRGTSALVQLFWFYFALPLVGVELGAMTAGILVLGLNTGAYGSEIVRGALRAVPPGQWDAALALGLSRAQAMRRVVFPQAAVAMLPPANNLLVELLKNTALVSLVTIADLTFEGQILRAATLRSGAIFGGILVVYYLLALGLSHGVRTLERHLARGRAVGSVQL
ncbi:MAG: ectoine/hydroxyectoine ABC transporter permease subunit EhuC [Candidatus Krumholzibacteriia bacterium]